MSTLSIEAASSTWFQNMTVATQTVDKVNDYVNDLVLVKWQLLYIALIGFFISFISMFVIRYFAGIFVWITILLFVISLFCLAGFSWQESSRLKDLASEEGYEDTENNTYYNYQTLYYVSITLFVIAGIVTLALLFNLGTIALSIAVIKSAALFVG